MQKTLHHFDNRHGHFNEENANLQSLRATAAIEETIFSWPRLYKVFKFIFVGQIQNKPRCIIKINNCSLLKSKEYVSTFILKNSQYWMLTEYRIIFKSTKTNTNKIYNMYWMRYLSRTSLLQILIKLILMTIMFMRNEDLKISTMFLKGRYLIQYML